MNFKALVPFTIALLFLTPGTQAQDSYQGFHIGQSLSEAFAVAGVSLEQLLPVCTYVLKDGSNEQNPSLADLCPKISRILAGELAEIDFPMHKVRLAFDQGHLVQVTDSNGTVRLQKPPAPRSGPTAPHPQPQSSVIPTVINDQQMNETIEVFAVKTATTSEADCGNLKHHPRRPKNPNTPDGIRQQIEFEHDFCNQLNLAQSGARTTVKTYDGWNWGFDHNRLVSAEFLDLDTDWPSPKRVSYDDYLKTATEKYGSPTIQDTQEWQNGYGARYNTRHAGWMQPDGTVILVIEYPKDPNGGVKIVVQTKEEQDFQHKLKQKDMPKF